MSTILTLSAEVLEASILTPEMHTNCVRALKPRLAIWVGMTMLSAWGILLSRKGRSLEYFEFTAAEEELSQESGSRKVIIGAES